MDYYAILPGFLTLGRCEGDDGNLAASGPLPEEEAVAGTGTQAGLSAAATEEEGGFEESPKWAVYTAGPREEFVFKLGSRGLGTTPTRTRKYHSPLPPVLSPFSYSRGAVRLGTCVVCVMLSLYIMSCGICVWRLCIHMRGLASLARETNWGHLHPAVSGVKDPKSEREQNFETHYRSV